MLANAIFQGLTDGVMKLYVMASVVIIIGVTWIIAGALRRIRQSDNRTALLGMMLQRGMSAEQIERVLNAGGFNSTIDAGDDDAAPDVRIIKVLNENSYEGRDVEHILAAAMHRGSIDAATAQVVVSMAEQGTEADEIARVLRLRRNGTPVEAAR